MKKSPAFIPDGICDVGTVKYTGKVSYDEATDTFTFTGAGENMWSEKDAFLFAWKKVSGDFDLKCDVAFEGEGVNPHRKLGFIIRETLDADSRYADIAVHGDGLNSLQYRLEKGGPTDHLVSAVTAPTRIEFMRRGNVFAARTGKGCLPDVDDVALEMELPEECYVGLFMCSHETDVIETGYLRNVEFEN